MNEKLNEIYVVYRYGNFRGWWGDNPYNEFVKITDKLDELGEVGRSLQREGRKKFTMRKKK